MICPKCGSNFVRARGRKLFQHPVLGPSVRRTLSCDKCHHRFYTVEVLQAMMDVLTTDHWGQMADLKKRLLEGLALLNSIESRRAIAAAAISAGELPDGS